MKRAGKSEQNCRRMEFKCKLYGIIKELERSLQSENERTPLTTQRRDYTAKGPVKDYKKKGGECCCPPGCCKESLEIRPPRLPFLDNHKGPEESQHHTQDVAAREDVLGHLPWHSDDHSKGCRPEKHHQRFQNPQEQPWGCVEPQFTTQGQQTPNLALPQTEEEMHRMGCFFARAV